MYTYNMAIHYNTSLSHYSYLNCIHFCLLILPDALCSTVNQCQIREFSDVCNRKNSANKAIVICVKIHQAYFLNIFVTGQLIMLGTSKQYIYNVYDGAYIHATINGCINIKTLYKNIYYKINISEENVSIQYGHTL